MSRIKQRHLYSPPDTSFLPSDIVASTGAGAGDGAAESDGGGDVEQWQRLAREDGRTPDDVRPVYMKLALVRDCSGSAYLEQGSTKVLCTVYGPRDIAAAAAGSGQSWRGGGATVSNHATNSHLTCTVKFAPFSSKIRCASSQYGSGGGGGSDFETDQSGSAGGSTSVRYEYMMLEALKPVVRLSRYNKVQIDAHLLVIEDGGSLLAAGVTCASLALTHAGVEMEDLVLGGSLLYVSPPPPPRDSPRTEHATYYMDPSAGEEEFGGAGRRCCGLITLAYMPAKEKVATIQQSGASVDMDTIVEALNLLTQTCVRYYPAVRDTILQHVREKVKETDI